MRAMNGLRICAVAAALSLSGAGVAHAAATVTQFKANGAMASHNSFDGVTAYDLAVNRNDTGTGTTTFFSFITQTCDANFTVCTGKIGFGNIPNGDFSATSAVASLNTNLATNAGFQLFNYVQDNANGTFTQTPTAGGIVTINWNKVPRQSQSFTGTQTLVSGGFSTRLTGTQTSTSARTTGTLLGVALPTTSASFIGTNSSSQIVIFRN